MNPRYLRNITLLLLVWLVSQQAVALVLYGVEHSPNNCHEQLSAIDYSLEQVEEKHGSHKALSSASQMPVCDHCATFCQPIAITSLPLHPSLAGQSMPEIELVVSIPRTAISALYRPPIII